MAGGEPGMAPGITPFLLLDGLTVAKLCGSERRLPSTAKVGGMLRDYHCVSYHGRRSHYEEDLQRCDSRNPIDGETQLANPCAAAPALLRWDPGSSRPPILRRSFRAENPFFALRARAEVRTRVLEQSRGQLPQALPRLESFIATLRHRRSAEIARKLHGDCSERRGQGIRDFETSGVNLKVDDSAGVRAGKGVKWDRGREFRSSFFPPKILTPLPGIGTRSLAG